MQAAAPSLDWATTAVGRWGRWSRLLGRRRGRPSRRVRRKRRRLRRREPCCQVWGACVEGCPGMVCVKKCGVCFGSGGSSGGLGSALLRCGECGLFSSLKSPPLFPRPGQLLLWRLLLPGRRLGPRRGPQAAGHTSAARPTLVCRLPYPPPPGSAPLGATGLRYERGGCSTLIRCLPHPTTTRCTALGAARLRYKGGGGGGTRPGVDHASP